MRSSIQRVSTLVVLLFVAHLRCNADEPYSLKSVGIPDLPRPVANNAVITVAVDERQYVISFNGIGQGLTHSDVVSDTFVFDVSTMTWFESEPVPGGVGRLASTAASVGGLAYVFGGYSVTDDGSEVSRPWVHAFNPVTRKFAELTPMPVPVDDAVSVTYEDRFIYLISGWHDLGNVNLVQRYDTVTDSWDQATPIPGIAVFGHAGGIVGNKIVYCDGVAVRPFPDKSRDFAANNDCFLGIIDKENSRRIDWRRMSAHPGPPRYRMAAAGIEAMNGVLFIGGSENPYNYDGMGYNSRPSEPASGALLFDLDLLIWRMVAQDSAPTMDHRALARFGDQWLTVGGMTAKQQVTGKVIAYSLER